MVQTANTYTERIDTVLALSSAESLALASLLYDIATGQIEVNIAPNHREALMQLYADAYYSGVRIDQKVKS